MTYLRTTALALATSVAATAAVAEQISVGEIDVKTELADFENSNALEYWPELDKDLSAALARMVTVTGESEDDRLVVAINSIKLDGSPSLPETGEFNQLEGAVVVYDYKTTGQDDGDTTVTAAQSFPLQLSAVSGDVNAPEGTIVITPSKDDYYNALVNGFAASVVERLQ